MLEHVASTIGPWVDIISGDLPQSSCILSMTDSTTSAGWLRKSNFMDESDTKMHSQAKMFVSREHAKRILQNNIREYSQWFKGCDNIIADSLSRDFHLDDVTLTSLFHSRFSQQIPPHFKIVPLQPEISSWIYVWLQNMPDCRQRHEELHSSRIELLSDGSVSSPRLIFPAMFSSQPSINNIESPSFLHSPTPYCPHNF